jgi:hypothetical protein
MKIECRDCWAEINILEDILADGILSYPDNGADFVIRSTITITITTTIKDKVKSRLAKNVDKDREQ